MQRNQRNAGLRRDKLAQRRTPSKRAWPVVGCAEPRSHMGITVEPVAASPDGELTIANLEKALIKFRAAMAASPGMAITVEPVSWREQCPISGCGGFASPDGLPCPRCAEEIGAGPLNRERDWRRLRPWALGLAGIGAMAWGLQQRSPWAILVAFLGMVAVFAAANCPRRR